MAYRETNDASNISFDPAFDIEVSSVDVQAAIEELKGLLDSEVSGSDWQNSALDRQVDATLDPGVSPATGARYVIEDSAALHANFGSITGVGDDDIVEYDGTDFVVVWDSSVQGEVGFCWVEAEDLLYYFSGTAWADYNSVIDHGGLTGLGDDDHTIYSKADGTRAYTGVVGGITPVAASDLATKGYVDGATGATALPIVTTAVTYAVLASDVVIIADVSGGSIDIDLEASPADGRRLIIKDNGSATGSLKVQIDPGGTRGIDFGGDGVKKDIKTSFTSLTVAYHSASDEWYLV